MKRCTKMKKIMAVLLILALLAPITTLAASKKLILFYDIPFGIKENKVVELLKANKDLPELKLMLIRSARKSRGM
jgi:hypothetical protein